MCSRKCWYRFRSEVSRYSLREMRYLFGVAIFWENTRTEVTYKNRIGRSHCTWLGVLAKNFFFGKVSITTKTNEVRLSVALGVMGHQVWPYLGFESDSTKRSRNKYSSPWPLMQIGSSTPGTRRDVRQCPTRRVWVLKIDTSRLPRDIQRWVLCETYWLRGLVDLWPVGFSLNYPLLVVWSSRAWSSFRGLAPGAMGAIFADYTPRWIWASYLCFRLIVC